MASRRDQENRQEDRFMISLSTEPDCATPQLSPPSPQTENDRQLMAHSRVWRGTKLTDRYATLAISLLHKNRAGPVHD
jgi:hypothetical protein